METVFVMNHLDEYYPEEALEFNAHKLKTRLIYTYCGIRSYG